MDCNITKNYLEERTRFDRLDYSIPTEYLERSDPERAIREVQTLSDEHPRKTYLQDFLEKFPDAPLNGFGCPKCCVKSIYKLAKCECNSPCYKCWNKEMKG